MGKALGSKRGRRKAMRRLAAAIRQLPLGAHGATSTLLADNSRDRGEQHDLGREIVTAEGGAERADQLGPQLRHDGTQVARGGGALERTYGLQFARVVGPPAS